MKNTITVPTKRGRPPIDERNNGAGAWIALGEPRNAVQRNSSSSSLDAVATAAVSRSRVNLSSLSTPNVFNEMGRRYRPASSALDSGIESLGGTARGAGVRTMTGLHSYLNDLLGAGGHAYTQHLDATQRDRRYDLPPTYESTVSPRSFGATSHSSSTDSLSIPMELRLNYNPTAAAYSSASASIRAQVKTLKLRQMEMEGIMFNHQHRQHQNQQRSNLLDNTEYASIQSCATSQRSGDTLDNSTHSVGTTHSRSSRSVLNDFTTSEILQEVSWRQSQLRKARDLPTGMDHSGGAIMVDTLSRSNSRDDLAYLQDTSVDKLDSRSSMALVARKEVPGVMPNRAAVSQHCDQDGAMTPGLTLSPRSKMGTDLSPANEAIQVGKQSKTEYSDKDAPLAKHSPSNASQESSSSDSSNSTVISDTQSPRPPSSTNTLEVSGLNKEQSASKETERTASFDALLSVAELDRDALSSATTDDNKSIDSSNASDSSKLDEKNGTKVSRENEKNIVKDIKESKASYGKRRFSESSSLSEYRRLSQADASKESSHNHAIPHINAPFERKRQKTELAPPLSSIQLSSSHLPVAIPPEYTRKTYVAASAMSSSENMKYQHLSVSKGALRERNLSKLQIQRVEMDRRITTPMRDEVHGRMGRLGFVCSSSPSLSAQNLEETAANAMLARLQGLPMPATQQVTLHLHTPRIPVDKDKPPATGKPKQEDLKQILKQFLDKYGEAAEKSRKGVLEAITKTEESLAVIDAWDRSRGLRKCHSRTVVKTRRSREKLKTFLQGDDPTKEIKKKRRKRE
mmetsp:Transcript_32124/g.67962  ORF Transcript_32124/g.67962 Transcript_32124/m.67962 type:complete len:799 (+) Transcript_32124:57-2453(+)|eukprot:CAMPEP_0183729834 /NCGR_PEP_ID=MMETSP0737-20130205/31330_1 /TAXON_ID=385413 /ORGANISM="Thalassiosira miniscula, Strain CCMP1093" /LENGTH=798 /DNA_ID=CAMNT_0025962141 /DNA_START=27 /DNA_END=2423 /DNA_ORIENTATION=-